MAKNTDYNNGTMGPVEVVVPANVPGNTTGQTLNIQISQPTAVKPHHVRKLVGESILDRNGDVVTFLSKRKEFLHFINDNFYLKFTNNSFRTDDPELLALLRSHPLYGLELFENEYPKYIKQEMEESRKYYTRDPNEHELNYRGM